MKRYLILALILGVIGHAMADSGCSVIGQHKLQVEQQLEGNE